MAIDMLPAGKRSISKEDAEILSVTEGKSAESSGEVGSTIVPWIVSISVMLSPALSVIAGSVGDALLLAGASLGFVHTMIRFPRRLATVFVFGLALVFIYILGSMDSPYGDRGLKHAATAFTGVSIVLYFAVVGRELVRSTLWKVMVCTIAVASSILIYNSLLPKNILAGSICYMMSILFVVLLTSERKPTATVMFLFSIFLAALGYLTEFRGMLAYSLVFSCAWIGSVIFPAWMFFLGFTLAASSTIYGLIWYFQNLYTSSIAAEISQLIFEWTQRPASSGREWLWPAILNAVGEDHWFGLGSGVIPGDFLSTDYSSHSYYLQTYLQVGLIGLFTLVVFLAAVWSLLTEKSDAARTFGSAIFAMFILHNASEVIMLQNGMMASAMAWMTIGIAMGVPLKYKVEKYVSG